MLTKSQQPNQPTSAKPTTPFFKPEPTIKPLAPVQETTTEHALEAIMRLPIQAVQRKATTPLSDKNTTQTPFFRPLSIPIQAKLTVGQPNDKYEQEADAVADKVVQRFAMPMAMTASPRITPFTGNGVQAKCATCEKEEHEHIQRKESGEMTASPSVESRLSATKGGGSRLPESTRTHMESAIGADFSNVRVHTGGEAVQLSQDLNAHAFTHGSDVYFNSGKFSPHTEGGQHLLAHELVHTVQQSDDSSRAIYQSIIQRTPRRSRRPTPPTPLIDLYPNRITMRWQETVEHSIFFYLRPYAFLQGLNDSALHLGINSFLRGSGNTFKINYAVGDEIISREGLSLREFETLNRQYPDPSRPFQVLQGNVLISTVGMSWDMYQTALRNPRRVSEQRTIQELLDLTDNGLANFGNRVTPIEIEIETETPEERAEVTRFFQDLFGSSAPPQQGNDVQQRYFHVSDADLEKIREFYRHTELERRAVIEAMHRGRSNMGMRVRIMTVSTILENAESILQIQAEDRLFHRRPTESEPNYEPIAARPIHGRIKPLGLRLSPPQPAVRPAPVDAPQAPPAQPQAVPAPAAGSSPQPSSAPSVAADSVIPQLTPPQLATARPALISYEATVGMETHFEFEESDIVDAFRVPVATIFWDAVDSAGRVIEHDSSHYITVRERSFLNNGVFDCTFHSVGTYTIHARVQHNFYYPAVFRINVVVITPQQDIDNLTQHTDTEEGVFGQHGEFTPKNFDMHGLSDIGSLDEGRVAHGTLSEEVFTGPRRGFQNDVAQLNQQIANLQLVRTHYQELSGDHASILDWVNRRITHLTDTRNHIQSIDGVRDLPIAIQAFYSSRQSGTQSGQLHLTAHYRHLTPQEGVYGINYIGSIFDRSEIAVSENQRISVVAANYSDLMNNMFVELSRNYPNGTMRMTLQIYDSNDQATRNTITFERVTETLGSVIHDYVYSSRMQLLVNGIADIMMIFPPTTLLGMGISLAYNAGQVLYDLDHALSTDTLHWSNLIDVGLLIADIIPGVSTAAHEVQTGRRLINNVGHLTRYGLQAVSFTEQALLQIAALKNSHERELTETFNRLQTLRQNHAPASEIQRVQEEMTQIESRMRNEWVSVVTDMAKEQAITAVVQHSIPAAATHVAHGLGVPTVHTQPQPPARAPHGEEQNQHPNVQDHATTLPSTNGTEAGHPLELPHSTPQAQEEAHPPVPLATHSPPVLTGQHLASELPHVAVNGQQVNLVENTRLPANEVRATYTHDTEGLVTGIQIEHGGRATLTDIRLHLTTIHTLQRYQGLSGRVRLALTRLRNILVRIGLAEHGDFPPGSRGFELKREIEKLPNIIREQASQANAAHLSVEHQLAAQRRVEQLETELHGFETALARLDHETLMERGEGYIAATGTYDRLEALRLGYPPPPPDHYYYRTPLGDLQIRRFSRSALPAQMVVHDASGYHFAPAPTSHDVAEVVLQRGQQITYAGGHGRTATAHRRTDGTLVILSQIDGSHGRQHFEQLMWAGVEFNLIAWERAHSQGQGTGHESPFGILYAPREVNQAFQSRGIEQHIRDLATQINPRYALLLTTETSAHSGTQRLSQINYRVEVMDAHGVKHLLYEASISVANETQNPRVTIGVTPLTGSIEQFMRPATPRGTTASSPVVTVAQPMTPQVLGLYLALTEQHQAIHAANPNDRRLERIDTLIEQLGNNPSAEIIEQATGLTH